jgi:lactate dehydrogenase-like 2-hydroxyacid dehydrogenase
MIISTFRHLPWCMTAGTSNQPSAFQECHGAATAASHNLRGHVLALVGLGNIGQQIAARCRHGFGMTIHYHDVVRKPAAVEHGLGAVFHDTLEGLLGGADCVVLCAPADGGGRAVINRDTLAWFRRGARFVNVARGSLVDEDALADALEEGRVSAVALDVHADEPNVSPRLLKFAGRRAMLTCHNAGGTVETHKGFEELSMRNIMAVLAGGEAITPVNMQYLKR